MLIDEEPNFQTVPELTKKVQIDGIPMVFLHVQRFMNNGHGITELRSDDSFSLPLALEKQDAYRFQEKLCIAFDEKKIFAGSTKIDKLVASQIIPKVGDEVQDGIEEVASRCGIISKINHQPGYYEVVVNWNDNNSDQRCTIGIKKAKCKRVYIKDISSRTRQLFVTFHFYGVMCLGEDFRKPMKDHIKSCLETTSKEELRVLAHLSLLFAFKVTEVLPSRSFQRLCCTLRSCMQTRDFNISAFIPNSAKEFAVVDSLGQFHIVHSIVADEILKLFLSKSDCPLSALTCEFLQYMLHDSENPSKDADIAINSLLYSREMYYTEENHITRKSFSNLIFTIEDREDKTFAIKVFRDALPLVKNCHAYVHFARYWSKQVNDFSEALNVINRAKKIANEGSEAALVQNVEGDIYREKLEHYCKTNSPNWENPEDDAYCYYNLACEAYQGSYRSNPLNFPLNGEIKVRLLFLNYIQKSYTCRNSNSPVLISTSRNPKVAESVFRCSQLLTKLEEFIKCGDGGKDSDSHEASLTSLKAQFFDVVDRDPKKVKKVLKDFIDSDVKLANKMHHRRWYVSLWLPGQMPKKYKPCSNEHANYSDLLKLLQDNIDIVGHNDIDMQLWLSVVRELPIGKDMDVIGDKLSKWKSNVSSSDSKMWVNFYLSIFYFVKLISCNETGAPLLGSSYKDANRRVQEEGKQNKSRSRIKEWLHETGKGFQCLRSGEQNRIEMRQFEGTIHSTEGRRSLISWKGIHVFFEPYDRTLTEQFNHGQLVKFTVGFSLRGVRAITVEAVPLSPKDCVPCSATNSLVHHHFTS